jgi:hypothetical protein
MLKNDIENQSEEKMRSEGMNGILKLPPIQRKTM